MHYQQMLLTLVKENKNKMCVCVYIYILVNIFRHIQLIIEEHARITDEKNIKSTIYGLCTPKLNNLY